jgi:cysteine desulfurase
VAAAVGLGEAARLVAAERTMTVERVGRLRDRLETGLVDRVPDARRTVPYDVIRTPGVAHLCFAGVESEALLFLLEQEGIAASAASSCASGAQQVSHVLAAMGIDGEVARGSVRLSLGYGSTDAEVDHALVAVPSVVERLREYS